MNFVLVADHIYSGLRGTFKGEQKVKQSGFILSEGNVQCTSLLSID